MVSFKFKYSINSFILLTVRNKKGRFGGRGTKKKREAVFPTTSSFFNEAGSIIIIRRHLFSLQPMGAEDVSQPFAHLRQRESTSIIVPLFSSWADLVNLHLKILWIHFWWIPHGRRMLNETIKCRFTLFNSILLVFVLIGQTASSIHFCWSESFEILQSQSTALLILSEFTCCSKAHLLGSPCRLLHMSQEFS